MNTRYIHKAATYKKSILFSVLALVSLGIGAAVLVHSNTTNAASTAGFNAGRIIDDSVFTSKDTMNAGQIQAFLTSKVSSCDTAGTLRATEYGRGDLTHAQYAATRGWSAPPYTCMKDYSVNGKSAAQIIYDVSQKYSINPQVFLVLLQKEQGLITDSWPLSTQYRTATGYGCPDTAPCDAQYYGLENQLDWSGKMFRSIMNNVPQNQWYTPYVLGNNYIQYSPTASCGGSTVNIQNRATQALYNYTPYQPNQGALNAGYGTADCGAYGNRNFYLYFSDWFGNPTVPPVYSWSPTAQIVYSDSARTVTLPYFTTVAPGQKFYATIAARNTGNQVWSRTNVNLATTNPRDQSNEFYNSDWASRNRPANMLEEQVAPGEVGTFRVSLTAPQVQKSYNLYFSLVVEGVAWMNDPGLYLPINVTPARELNVYSDSAKTNKLSGPSFSAYAGSTLYATLNMTNTSSSPLPREVMLGTTSPTDHTSVLTNPSWISANRAAQSTSVTPIVPGGTAAFNFTLKVPTTLGTYPESFGLVYDGAGGQWFETNTATFSVTSLEKPKDVVTVSQQLNVGDGIRSADGRYILVMQSDGNLVLYSPSRAVWASNTNGTGANTLIMQSDGNLVLYSPSRGAVWASNTAGSGGNVIVMQSDGNLVLYSPSRAPWASNTSGKL